MINPGETIYFADLLAAMGRPASAAST